MTILPPSKPFARGVSQLMYVGDDDAVEKSCSSLLCDPLSRSVILGGVFGFLAVGSRTKNGRWFWGGAAAFAGIQALRAVASGSWIR